MFRLINRGYKTFRTMSIFTQKFDPITGSTAWELQDPDYDYHQEVARSAFADMLHDHERNLKYYEALKAAIDKTHGQGKKANVLDIGTGTGLLSMMAAKCGADTITACEAFRPMADCALKIIEENGFGSKIKLVRKRSTEMTVGENGDMPQRANILVTEVFDTELIGEGALSTFQHAQQVLLEKDSLVVPSSGTVWVQLVESEHVRSWNRINPLRDPSTGETLLVPPKNMNNCPGASAVHDIQLTQLPRDSFVPLLSPQPMFTFDWTGKKPLVFSETASRRAKPLGTGTGHAVFMWWDLVMDSEGKVLLSCAPVWEHPDAKEFIKNGASLEEASDKIPWRDHWMQAVYYLPEECTVDKENYVNLVASHDEYSFSFSAKKADELSTVIVESSAKVPVCDCTLHLAYSRTRIGQLNDVIRNEKYLQVLKKNINSDTTCLCLSDCSLLGLAAASMGAKKVFVLEPSYLSRRTIQSFVAANRLESQVSVVESLSDLPEELKPNLVFGDPYYVTSILPWDNLRFWYLVAKHAPLVKPIPMGVKILAVAVEFKDLHKIRSPLGICEGFDLTTFDKIVQTSSEISDNPVEAHPLWEYPAIARGRPFEITYFDFADIPTDVVTTISGEEFCERGKCNGIAIWVDWYLDSETIVSTGPTREIIPGDKISWDIHTRQGVFFMKETVDFDKTSHLEWKFSHKAEKIWHCNFDFIVKSK